MKTISVKQPWANFIASGYKTIETRTWNTNYRGKLLIASSQKPHIYPAGYVVALVTLVDCRDMKLEDMDFARCGYRKGLKAWVLDNIRKVKPIPVKGQLRIYESGIKEEDLEFI